MSMEVGPLCSACVACYDNDMDQMRIGSGPPSELDEGPPHVELEEREDARLEAVYATELLVPETMHTVA